MAHQLQLGYVGNQARIFQGKLLGLPVIGLPHRSQSMVNLKVTLETHKHQTKQHFGTQVTSGIETPLSVLTEQIDTLYSFNEFVDLKGKFMLKTEEKIKLDGKNQRDQSPDLSKKQLLLKHKNLLKQSGLPSPKNENLYSQSLSSARKSNLVPLFGAERQKLQQSTTVKTKKRSGSIAINKSQLRKRKSVNFTSTQIKPLTLFSYDTLPQTFKGLEQTPQSMQYQAPTGIFRPPRPSKPAGVTLEIIENPKLKRFESQPQISNTMPLIPAKEATAAFLRPVEYYSLNVQSKIPGFEFEVKTKDQYVYKHFKQGKINKIKSKEPEVNGLIDILKGEILKAQKRFKGRNLCLCLIEQSKYEEALHVGRSENFIEAIAFINTKYKQPVVDDQLSQGQILSFLKTKVKDKQSSARSLPQESLSEKNDTIHIKGLVESSNTGSSQKSQVFDLPDKSETPFRPRAFQIMSRSANNFNSTKYLKQENRPFSSMTPISDNNSAKVPPLISDQQQQQHRSESILEKSGPHFRQSSGSTPQIFFPTLLKDSEASQTLDLNQPPKMVNQDSLQPNNKGDSRLLSVHNQSTYTSQRRAPSQSSLKVKQVSDFKTDELLSSLVAQRLAGIERFKLLIGGQEKMERYIAQYAEEWRSGKIRYQNTYKIPDRPWSSKQRESAYDLSKTKYKEYKGTINLLVEGYLNRDEQPVEEISQSNFKIKMRDDLEGTESARYKINQSQISGVFLEHKFSQTEFGFEQGHSMQESSKIVKNQTSLQQSSHRSKKDQQFDIEIPQELQERYQNALKTVKQGIQEPQITQLMSTELTPQEIYDRAKAVRHLEKFLADDDLLSANSEHLEEDFWSRVKVVHKDLDKQDIFFIDEAMNEGIIERLRLTTENNEEIADFHHQETNPPIQNLLQFLGQKQQEKQELGDNHLSIWFKRLYDEISVSRSLHMLLEQRFKQFKEESPEKNHSTEKPQNLAYSVLLTIREQFARKEMQGEEVDYEMLGRMLSQNNYFSHFESATRKKLILISQHRLLKQGEVLLHSDQLSDTIAVVVSGAVSVHMCNKAKKNLRSFRNTLYPGESIGDAPLRLIIPADKVGHVFFELRAAVDSDVLLIKKDDVPSILENEIRSLMTSRIIPLQRCSLFSGAELQSPYSIFVLANLVQTKTFQIGDVIQQQGKQAEDILYLVVRGFCKAVFQTTLVQFNRRKKERLPKLSNSKEPYGELGIIQQHLKSVNPGFVVKNIRESLRAQVRRQKPGYLPKVKLLPKLDHQEKRSSGSTAMMFTHSSQELKKITLQDEVSEKMEEGDTLAQDQVNTADSDDSEISNRTQKLKDQEALVGHMRPKIIESTFKFIEPQVRVTQNRTVDPNNLTELGGNNVHILKSKLAAKDLKTVKIDLIEHTQVIGEGQTFCSRALLDKQRCIKQLQNELNDYLEQLRIAEEEREKEFLKNSPYRSRKGTKSSLMGDQELQTQMEENDNNLPEGIKPKQPDVKDEPKKKEQIGIQSDSDAFQQIFKQLRALLGDEQVINKTAAELFAHVNQSQLTIVADSSDVLVLCIRRQDLSQLSEPVRRRIERDVLGQLFIDLDRPFTDRKDVNRFLAEHRQWQKFKLNTADSIIFNQ